MKKSTEPLNPYYHARIWDVLKNNTDVKLEYESLRLSGMMKPIAEFLKSDTVVTSLNLASNNLGTAGAELIAEILKVNKTIVSINLQDNNIGVKGVKYIVKALRDNSSLTSLDLSKNQIGDGGATLIIQFLESNMNTMLTYFNIDNINYSEEAKTITVLLQKNINLIKENEDKSEELNIEGNYLFSKEQYIEALEKHNQAISFSKKPWDITNKIHAEKYKELILQNKENERTKALQIFEKTLTDVTEKLKEMQNTVDEIAQKTKTLKDKTDIEQVTSTIQTLVTSNKITIRKLWALEEDVEELVDQQLGSESNIETTINNEDHEKSALMLTGVNSVNMHEYFLE